MISLGLKSSTLEAHRMSAKLFAIHICNRDTIVRLKLFWDCRFAKRLICGRWGVLLLNYFSAGHCILDRLNTIKSGKSISMIKVIKYTGIALLGVQDVRVCVGSD